MGIKIGCFNAGGLRQANMIRRQQFAYLHMQRGIILILFSSRKLTVVSPMTVSGLMSWEEKLYTTLSSWVAIVFRPDFSFD